MNPAHSVGLIPVNGCVLVELKQSYQNLNIKEGKYDTRTEGIVAAPENHEFYGKRVFFEEFKEGARIKRDSKAYSFIKVEDIRGYEEVNEQTSN